MDTEALVYVDLEGVPNAVRASRKRHYLISENGHFRIKVHKNIRKAS